MTGSSPAQPGAAQSGPGQLTPGLRRRRNQRAMWNAKYLDAQRRGGAEAVARAAFDRARASAVTAQRRAGTDAAWEDLAALLSGWCDAMEDALSETRHRRR